MSTKKTFPYSGMSVRNFRNDLRDRLRVVAALSHRTMEEVLNDAVERGLRPLEAAIPLLKGKVKA